MSNADLPPHETAVHVVVTGRVQGVWYRGWTVERAGALGIRGWVRNRRDGSVEAVFCGDQEKVDRMIAACRTGPPAADVTAIAREDAPLPDEPDFRQISTV
ncbi:MAG: acylphosphatase [Proteobacteria bacterium]|nr:acylphosphatase [Pseudomonadota bacterium]